jgi:hypothetical protein
VQPDREPQRQALYLRYDHRSRLRLPAFLQSTHRVSLYWLSRLKAKIGFGAVICTPADILPIDKKNWFVLAWFI